MTKETKEAKKTGLDLLREPFPANQISKLPKPTKAQTDAVKADYKAGIRCKICGGWHHPDVIHLDYVGHAALTDRLLDADPNWTWEPNSYDQAGAPYVDKNNGLWIKLTVCGVTRLGYGHPDGKTGGDAVKEAIGDALRNAAMRFGAALDLWHKGDLHAEEPITEPKAQEPAMNAFTGFEFVALQDEIKGCADLALLGEAWKKFNAAKARMTKEQIDTLTKLKDKRKSEIDDIPKDFPQQNVIMAG